MHDLSLYLLELLENSVRAGASQVEIRLRLDKATDQLILSVDDDGQGLDAAPESVVDPFYTTKAHKKTGLGLSLLKADAQTAGGDLVIGQSPTLSGTRVQAHMRLGHVDRVPLGRCGQQRHRYRLHQPRGRVHGGPHGRSVLPTAAAGLARRRGRAAGENACRAVTSRK